MRLYGALSELASLVIRLASGKTVKIEASEQTAAGETIITIPNVVDGADEMVMKDTAQTLTNKTLTAPVMTSADVQSAATLQLPVAAPATNALGRIYLSGSDLRFGTSATPGAFEQVVTQTSASNLTYKTINLAGGNGNSILNANPVSILETDAINNIDKVVKYTALGAPTVAKISNANIADNAAIVGSKLVSIPAASLSPMSSADLAGIVTDETGSGALVFANNPTIGSMTAASGVLSIAGTGALKVPAGLGSERPGSPVEGMIRYNSETDSFEGYASNAWSGIGGGGTVDRINKVGHAFVVGDVLYLNAAVYEKARADAANTAEVVGMVSRVIDVDNFEMTLSGEVGGLTGLVAGEVYFLSAATAGLLTVTEPSVVGQVSLPVGVASSTTSLYVAPKRGVVVGGANLRTQIGLNGAALVSQTTNIQNVTAYTAGELSGWVYIDATTDRRFYIQVQFVKDAANAWKVAYQTTGDTPTAGFNVDVIISGPDAFVQVQMPPVAGWVSGSVNFALNVPAVGATLPLQIDGGLVSGPVLGSTSGVAPAAGRVGQSLQSQTLVGGSLINTSARRIIAQITPLTKGTYSIMAAANFNTASGTNDAISVDIFDGTNAYATMSVYNRTSAPEASLTTFTTITVATDGATISVRAGRNGGQCYLEAVNIMATRIA